jgi:hypothetical protein
MFHPYPDETTTSSKMMTMISLLVVLEAGNNGMLWQE